MLDIISNILQSMVIYATPLILTALGGLYSERSGVVNIGLEGMMIIGAFTAAITSHYTGSPWLALLFAAIAGMFIALPHAVASITLKADQVVSGVAVNFLALGVSVYLVKTLFDAGQTPTVPVLERISIPILNEIPVIGTAFFDMYPTSYLAVFVVIITYIILFHTVFGMRLRAVGEHPHAAETGGISVVGMRYTAVIISGILAALGGAGLSIAIGNEFNATTVAGQGFIALAALIFGKWHPLGAFGAASFFGLTVALALVGQLVGLTAYVPSGVLNMIPYVLTILVLAGFVGRAEAPSALGKPFEKGTR
ncbi:ABC transporter permease [Mechercharimyces sp. CAU 1602]|uniref:ABC transporter permease n=1 Tax=Mechercharimyces sp. CAU 1602 TaxID=2973933 RepID=UPI0028683193|nr:ABC transporter permease [Mechercharimyces sp. CAU 1602]